MPVVIDGSAGITDADGGTVLSTADIASQVQAEAGTDNTTVMTPLRLRNALNASGSAPTYACRAWVNFNGTGTVAIRASGNVSSITDVGAGNYTVNFATAMPDANFVAVVSAMTADGVGGVRWSGAGATTTSSVKVYSTNDARAGEDTSLINVAIFR